MDECWECGDDPCTCPPEPEVYETDISCGPLDWWERANSAGISLRGLLRMYYKGFDRVHEASIRASPLLTIIKGIRASPLLTIIKDTV